MERDSKALIGAAVAAKAERRKRAKTDTGSNRGSMMRALFGIFPLLAIPVAIYNLLASTVGGDLQTAAETGEVIRQQAPLLTLLSESFLNIPMISGVVWQMTKGDALILVAVALLFMEVLKSTSTGTATIMNHAVSMILFIVCLIQFLLMPNFATSIFFLLTVITLLDVLAGVVVTIVSARRDFGVADGL